MYGGMIDKETGVVMREGECLFWLKDRDSEGRGRGYCSIFKTADTPHPPAVGLLGYKQP